MFHNLLFIVLSITLVLYVSQERLKHIVNSSQGHPVFFTWGTQSWRLDSQTLNSHVFGETVLENGNMFKYVLVLFHC